MADVRSGHPLQAVVPVLRKMLVEIADASQHIMIVTDAQGTILWRKAIYAPRRRLPVGLREGTRWAEDAIGTNAMGTALAEARRYSLLAEHLGAHVPHLDLRGGAVHDPDTGTRSARSTSAGIQNFHPAVISLVSATAELAESHLRVQLAIRDERLRAKNMAHLAGLRGEAGALLTPTGRVLAAEPSGVSADRVDVRPVWTRAAPSWRSRAVLKPLPEGYLLRVPRSRHPGSRRRRCRCRSSGNGRSPC